MRVTITIDCDNAAFDGLDCGPEVARILEHVAANMVDVRKSAMRRMFDGSKLRDANGNTVGRVAITEE